MRKKISTGELIIFQNEIGDYELFNSYNIHKTTDKEFIVSLKHTHTEIVFYTLKNAVTWCVYDKRNMLYEANRIIELDTRLDGIEVDISIHQNLFKKAKDEDNKLIFLSKLSDDRIKKRTYTEELNGYANESKRWQTNRFNRKPEQ